MRKKSDRSIADIAAALGISASTVSRALRQLPSISGKTTRMVLAEAQRQGYFIHERKNVVIVRSDAPMGWYDVSILNPLCARMSRDNITWEIVNSQNFSLIPERLVHGIISLDFRDRRSLNLAHNFNLPLVAINEAPCISEKAYAVHSDAVHGMTMAMNHLKNLGHKKVLFLYQNSETFCSCARLNAFRSISRTIGSGVWQAEALRINKDTAEGLLARVAAAKDGGFTALIVEGESAGVAACNHLVSAGYRIPEDFSLLCWETPGISDLIMPGITTVEQDFTALAERAMDIMEALWKDDEAPFSVTVPYLFHQRDSTAAVQ